jgi:hypothetical protein
MKFFRENSRQLNFYSPRYFFILLRPQEPELRRDENEQYSEDTDRHNCTHCRRMVDDRSGVVWPNQHDLWPRLVGLHMGHN